MKYLALVSGMAVVEVEATSVSDAYLRIETEAPGVTSELGDFIVEDIIEKPQTHSYLEV